MSKKDRFQIEQEMAEAISEQLMEDMRYLNNLEEPPPDFWHEEKKKLRDVILPLFLLAMTIRMEETAGIPELPYIDFDTFMGSAQSWASNYVYDLVSGITNKTQLSLQSAFASFFSGGIGEAELRSRIAYWFSPYRAETIAITEVTRAVQSGMDYIFGTILQKYPGFGLEETWKTAGDERVCELCSPLDGTPKGVLWFSPPPLHPRCRCEREIKLIRK
jgi:hypothetical protein